MVGGDPAILSDCGNQLMTASTTMATTTGLKPESSPVTTAVLPCAA